MKGLLLGHASGERYEMATGGWRPERKNIRGRVHELQEKPMTLCQAPDQIDDRTCS